MERVLGDLEGQRRGQLQMNFASGLADPEMARVVPLKTSGWRPALLHKASTRRDPVFQFRQQRGGPADLQTEAPAPPAPIHRPGQLQHL